MIGSRLKSQAGFTVMETVLVLGIFSIATTYAISIFVQSNAIQKRTANVQRTTSDARYVLEVMAREFRMGSLDYTFSGYQLPLTDVQSILALRDENNQPVRFRRSEVEAGRFAVQICSSSETCAAPGDWLEITPPELSVERLSFYLSPSQSPFVWQLPDYAANQQPLLTIVLETKSLLYDPTAAHLSHFQTTVSSRNYQR